MILKGNQRGGGQQMAAHLMNSFDNERVEIADLRGAIADDLSGAFAEWAAEARGTKCQKFLYSLSLNPDQAQGHLTREQYLELLERTERSLKLVGQPRAVVFHEKRDEHGVLREHCHAVWSRIDTDKMKAVHIAHDRLKLRSVARDFARDHGLELPDGMKKDSRRDRFNDRAKQENLGERQQKERTGISKEQRMADIATCWKETGNGAAFVQALEAKGYYLARGDQRAFVVVDLHSEVHSLSRQLSGIAKSKELKERLAGYPLDKLPDVESAQAWAKTGLLGRRRGGVERDIHEFRGARRANRPTIDAGGFDAHEQPSVEAGIAGRNRAVAGDAVHIHHAILVHPSGLVSRFSDIIVLDHSCQMPPSILENKAGGGAMGEQTPVAIRHPSLGGADAPTPAQHHALRLDQPGLGRNRPQQ